MLRVIAWLWRQPGGRTQYAAAHANAWAAMVRRHMTLPHRIACVTDMPEGIDRDIEIIAPPRDFEDVRIPTWHEGRPQCLRRIAMFRPDAAKIFGKRFVCMDLDCVIGDSLDPLFDVSDDFKMNAGTARRRLYNGSMMLMTAGARPQVYEQFTPEAAAAAGKQFVGSDQAWISHVLGPGEATWGPDDGVLWWGSPENARVGCRRIMFFPGQPKPWEVVADGKDAWVVEHYRADSRGRCLILGSGPTVWDDAAVALSRYGKNMPIIALPDTARYCDKVVAVAEDDAQADRFARMHGFDPIWCGRSDLRSQEAAA